MAFQFQTHLSQNCPDEITPISHMHISQMYFAYIQKIKKTGSAK